MLILSQIHRTVLDYSKTFIYKKNVEFKFGETELKAFELLKSKLVSAPFVGDLQS